MNFAELGLCPPLLQALTAEGYTTPTPIQLQAIPHVLAGRDVQGIAQTGTGKTAAFALPILHRLAASPRRAAPGGCRVLVLSPTRELASQIADSFRAYGKFMKLTCTVMFGGVPKGRQSRAMAGGVDVLVATPGRLIDLSKQHKLDLSKISFMVLDEADEMLDLGFLPDVEKLFAFTPATRQTLLFSATMPGAIVTMARKYQNRPMHIRANEPDEGHTKADIKQFVYRVHSLDKDEMVGRILQAEGRGKTVIFAKTKRQASKVS